MARVRRGRAVAAPVSEWLVLFWLLTWVVLLLDNRHHIIHDRWHDE